MTLYRENYKSSMERPTLNSLGSIQTLCLLSRIPRYQDILILQMPVFVFLLSYFYIAVATLSVHLNSCLLFQGSFHIGLAS